LRYFILVRLICKIIFYIFSTIKMALISQPYNFFNEMDKVMDNALGRFFGNRDSYDDMFWPSLANKSNYHNFQVDVVENDGHFEVLADAPGLTTDDIRVEHQDGYLVIQAERKIENENKNKKYYKKERGYTKLYRSFLLPENIDTDNIVATLDKGVLKVSLPKLANTPIKTKKLIPIKTI
jgi:HSP20 family protein